MRQFKRFTLTIFAIFAGKLTKEVSSNQLINEQLTNNQQILDNNNDFFLNEELDYNLQEILPSVDLIQEKEHKRELQNAHARKLASKNITINLNNYSLLASPLSDQDLQTINTKVFYINQQGYKVYSSGRSVISPDITTTLNETLLCPKEGDKNCYILLMANTTIPGYPKSKVKCLTTNLCFLSDVQNNSNQIVGILGYPFLVQKIPIDQAWTSNSTIFWSKSKPYLLLDQIPDPSYAANVQNLVEPRLCIKSTQCFWQFSPIQPNSQLDPNLNLIQLGLLNFTAQNDNRVFDVMNLAGQNIYVVTLKLSEAWYSQDFVIWQGLYPYKLIDVLDETRFFTLKPDLTTLGACLNQTNCYDNIVKVDVQDPFAQNDSVTCLGTTCFSAESTTRSEQVILIDDLSFLVSKVNFIDGWSQNETIFWNGPTPYRLIIPILNEQFYTIPYDPIAQRLCFENSWTNCLINLRHVKSTEVTDQRQCQAPQNTACYSGDTDTNVYEIMALQNATFIATQIGISSAWYLNQTVIYKSILDSWQMYYPLLDNDFSTDQIDISDPNLRVCTGGYNTNCYTEISILEEIQQQINENTFLSDQEDGSEETEEQTEGEKGFCIGQFCFQGTLDINKYDIISVNSETVLVVQSTVALSWNSQDSVVWLKRINPFIPVMLLQNNSFSTIQVTLDEIKVCYGQDECYIDITEIQVEDPQAENDTVKCYDSICYSGKIDQKNWQIALIDGDSFLVEQLTFSQAWQSQEQIIWNNQAESFLVYDLLDDRTFWTISLDILEILICSDGMNNCLSNLVYVDENTPQDQLTDQRCFGGFCYTGEPYYTSDCKIVCLKDQNKNYCYFAIRLDNSTAKSNFAMEVIWINQTAYNLVIPVEANIPGSIISNINAIVDCLPGDGCYTNLKNTKLNESTDTVKVICKQEYGKCWQGIPYDLEIDSNSDGNQSNPDVGKEFIISLQDTNIIGQFKQILFQDAWLSTDIVFWVEAIPYQYQKWLNSPEIIDQNIKVDIFRICLSTNKCYVNIKFLDETSEYNNTELCIQDACFEGDLDESEREVALLGDITVLVIKLDYEKAFTSTYPIIWQFKNGYDVQFVINYNQFHTIVLALNSVFGCFGEGVQNCYNNFVPALKGQSVKSYQSINCYNQVDQCYKMDQFDFPYKTPEQYASIYKGEPRQVRLCFESYCMDAQESSFVNAWNEETNDAYIWVGQQPYIPLQISYDDSQQQETIYGELDNTVICPEGIKPAKSRFDKYCSKPLFFYESSNAQESEEKINCVRQGSDICFSYTPFIVSEKVIYFTDQEFKMLVQDINFTEAWYSNETILWYNGLDPYKLIDSVDIQAHQNLDFKLLDVQICYEMNDCWINFQNFNDQYTYSIEKPYKCLIDYCFVAQFDDTSYSIALINNKTFFFQELSFENAWYSESEIIWYDQTGYKMLKQADSNGFHDLIINYKQLIYCLKGGKICVNKLRPVNPREQQKKIFQTIKLGPDFYNSDIYSKLNIKPAEKRKDVLCYEKIQEQKLKRTVQQEDEKSELLPELKNYQSLKSKKIESHEIKKANKKNIERNFSNSLNLEKNLKKNSKRSLQSLNNTTFEQNKIQKIKQVGIIQIMKQWQ